MVDFEKLLPINVVQYLYKNPEVLAGYREHFDQINWGHSPSQCLYSILAKFFDKYSKFPSKAEYYALLTRTQQFDQASDSMKLFYKAALKKITEREVDPATSERVIEFIYSQHLKQFVRKTEEFLESDLSYEAVQNFTEDKSNSLRDLSALAVGEQQEAFRPFSAKAYDTIKDKLESINEHECVPIFSPRLTKLSGGGYRRKELSAVLGIMGRGKTTYLLNNAKHTAYDLGRFTILITLDDSPIDIHHRIWKCLGGPDIGGLSPEDLERYIKENCETNDMLEHLAFARDTKTVNNIRYEIDKIVRRRQAEARRKVEKGEWTDEEAEHFCDLQLVVIDYADEIKTTNAQDQFRHRESAKFKEMATMAFELNCAILTATQSNRVGLESNTLTLNNVSESLAKFNVCKFCVSLSASDGELNSGAMRIAIIKNNHGTLNACVPMVVNWECQRIQENEKKAVTSIQTTTTPRTDSPPREVDTTGLAGKLEGSGLIPTRKD